MTRMTSPAVSVIVPTYNEVENIVEILDRIRATLRDWSYEIIVGGRRQPRRHLAPSTEPQR